MTLHKLTAGDGYEYLTRQVAASDSTNLGRTQLADYYSAKGESPGRWMGSGLASLADTGARAVCARAAKEIWTVEPGSQVTAEQMRALFGEGKHPNAEAISAYVGARGVRGRAAMDAAKLGREFYIRDGETGFVRALAVAYRKHNEALGREWNAPIDAPTRARIRTALAREKFAQQYGRAPADDRELSGFFARETRARTTAVAGYDLTFSPVKSVSALWAIAPQHLAQVVEQCHDAAVADALTWLEHNAALTRSGTNGVAQLDTTGLIGAAFTHRDSRAGDPDLHTHVAISNKVAVDTQQGCTRWLALDGQVLHRVVVAASELYNTRLEAHLGARLNLRFGQVAPTERGKRAVREIIGMPVELMAQWSSRRAAIERRTAELSKQFQHVHGREPSFVEMIALAQQATLESREAKHEPRSLAEQRHTWRTQAIEILGGARELTALLSTVLSRPALHREPVTDDWIAERAGEVIATVSTARATWQPHHVFAEAQRVVRGRSRAADDTLAARITDAALGEAYSIPIARVADSDVGEPVVLRRRDGASVYTRHRTQLFTSTTIVAAEQRILHAASRCDGRTVTDDDVAFALADAASRGTQLNPGQAALVTEMATTGRRVALALAPAGAGKTTAMAALSHAWRTSGGNVIGLAPTASAAITLGTDLCASSDTVDKYIDLIDNRSGSTVPQWFTDINEHTLLIIDEAGKAGTLQLDAVIGHALLTGASVRLVGDDHQIASISAGGVLRDIAVQTGALTLSQIVRFTSPAEAAASLALHQGDPAGIGFYIDCGRVHVGADATAAQMAFEAWLADNTAGRDSLLLAPTNQIVDDLNARARAARLAAWAAADPSFRVGRQTILSDDLEASAGDIIRSRKNARWLRLSATDYVRNGYTYEILKVGKDGSLRVRHLGSAREITLPADYVGDHVTLGYAATIDSAQGLTAGHSCHVVGAEHISRQLLYVALTRAREENHIYLSTAEADPHRVLSPKATHPDTAVDVLTKILARDDAQVSATTASRQAADPFSRLGAAADMYYDALGTAAETYAGPQVIAGIDEHADTVYAGLTDMVAWPILRKHLAILAVNGVDPIQALASAAARRELDTAGDVAAVLDWRLDHSGKHSAGIGPLAWLPAIPGPLRSDRQFGVYLTRRWQLAADLAEHIRATARCWTVATAPAWARAFIGVAPELAADIAVFRAAHQVAAEDTRILGPDQYAVGSRTMQRRLQQAATAVITSCQPQTRRWKQLLDSIDARIAGDSYWPQLAARLADATRIRADLATLVTTTAATRPLPDELPAAALWWRLAAELTPAATLETTHSRLRPAWIRDLHAVFGSVAAETIIADPAWPGLVAAIAAADPRRWTPADLLHVAAEHLTDTESDHPIGIYDYARLITYTVDLFCTTVHPNDAALPDHPPIHPDEEEQLPPDPLDHPHQLDPEVPDTNPFHNDPNPIDGNYDTPAHGNDHLMFDDLTTTRPAPPALAPALADVHALRDRYTAARASLAALERDVRVNNGPAMRAATAEIGELRRRADADRPYLLAVQEVITAWAEADHDYESALNYLTWARQQRAQLHADPAADPLDIESARLQVRLAAMALPATSPAQHYHPKLAAAQQARAAAAGGPEHLISGDHVDAYIAKITDTDWQTTHQTRQNLAALRAQLQRAEDLTARAFAAAQTRTAQHITAQRHQLDTELRVLEVAGNNQPQRALGIAPNALVGLPADTAAALTRLAEIPFTVTALHATPGKHRSQALHTLHAAYNAAGRKILWTSPTHTQAQTAIDNQLADTATTITDVHTKLSNHHWHIPPHTLLIVDDAATAEPEILADLAEIADQAKARIILLDTTTQQWPPQPSQRLLRLLSAELPWSMTLGHTPTPPTAIHHAPDLDPILTQTRQLPTELLDEPLRAALTRADQLRATNTNTYQRHLTITWTRNHHQHTTLDRRRDTSVDISDS